MENNIKTKTLNSTGDLQLTIESENYDGKIGDTKISITEGCLCYVSGEERDKFIEELEQVISKYRI